jgi:hypothetical protein
MNMSYELYPIHARVRFTSSNVDCKKIGSAKTALNNVNFVISTLPPSTTAESNCDHWKGFSLDAAGVVKEGKHAGSFGGKIRVDVGREAKFIRPGSFGGKVRIDAGRSGIEF